MNFYSYHPEFIMSLLSDNMPDAKIENNGLIINKHLVMTCDKIFLDRKSIPFPEIKSNSNLLDADFFVIPTMFVLSKKFQNHHVIHKLISCIQKKLQSNGKKLFFLASDTFLKGPFLGDYVFQTCSKKNFHFLPLHLNVSIPQHNYKPITEATIDVVFKGTIWSHVVRRSLQKQVSNYEKKINIFFEHIDFRRSTNKDHHGWSTSHLTKEQIDLRNDWFKLMADSKFVLCPRGGGPSSIRFYEALSIGRIPIVISDEVALPLSNILEYEKFSIRIPERDIQQLPLYINAFLKNNDLEQASKLAKKSWLNFFSNGSFFNFIEASVKNPIFNRFLLQGKNGISFI